MKKPKQTKKPTKKERKATKKVKPLIKPVEPMSALVAEHYVSDKMWQAVKESIHQHGLEPTSQDHYLTVQGEGARLWRIDSLVECIHDALDHYYGLDLEELKTHPNLDYAIDEIYAEFADEVVHEYLDAEDDPFDPKKGNAYFKPAEISCPSCGEAGKNIRPTSCDDCDCDFEPGENVMWYGLPDENGKTNKEAMLCEPCFEERENTWGICYQSAKKLCLVSKDYLFKDEDEAMAKAKELAEMNKGRFLVLIDAKGECEPRPFFEEAPLILPGGEVVKKEGGTLGQLALFGGTLLGAGIAAAAMGNASGVRVAEVGDNGASEVIDAVFEEAVK